MFNRLITEYRKHDVSLHSAALSYYIFIGLSSVLVIMVSFLSYLIKYEQASQAIITTLSYFLNPELVVVATQILSSNNNDVGMGILGFIILVFSSTAALSYFQNSLNYMFLDKKESGMFNFLKRRLIGMITLLIIALILISIMLITSIVGSFISISLLQNLSYIVQVFVMTIFLFSLYRYIPAYTPNLIMSLKISFLISLMIFVVKIGFDLFIHNSNFIMLYGVVSYSVVSLLFIYVIMNLVLVGAIMLALDKRGKLFYK